MPPVHSVWYIQVVGVTLCRLVFLDRVFFLNRLRFLVFAFVFLLVLSSSSSSSSTFACLHLRSLFFTRAAGLMSCYWCWITANSADRACWPRSSHKMSVIVMTSKASFGRALRSQTGQLLRYLCWFFIYFVYCTHLSCFRSCQPVVVLL